MLSRMLRKMLRKVCTLVGLATLLVAASTLTAFAQQAIQSRKLPASTLRTMKPHTLQSSQNLKRFGITKNAMGLKTAASSSIPGIDSIVNWSDQFNYPGFDGNGNAQSVWPYTMVGNPPESGQTTSIKAPIVPVTVELLGPDGSVALTFGPDGNVVNAALSSPEFEPFIYTNGVGQFNDQMMRAAFADRLHHHHHGDGDDQDGWHTILKPKLRTARTIQVPFLTASGANAWYYFVNAAGQPAGSH